MEQISVKQLPAMNLAHYKIVGRFEEIGKAYQHLMEWAGSAGVLNSPDAQVMTVYHADPEKTGFDKVEQSACVAIPESMEVTGAIKKMKFEGGKYAVGHYEITSDGFTQAWEEVCKWVKAKGYAFNKGISCELYYNDHDKHPEKKHIVDICVPVK